MEKILVLGYFGYRTGQLDGQTVKTRDVCELLRRRLDTARYKVDYFDTQVLQSGKWRMISLIAKLLSCRKVVYLPGQNNLSGFFLPLHRLSRLLKFDILYVMIGGWLADFLKEHPEMVAPMASLRAIFPENRQVKARLEKEYGFSNVVLAPNFRFLPAGKPQRPQPREAGTPFRLVFLSRVSEQKGIFTVFSLMDWLRGQGIPARVDFYGALDEASAERFSKALASCPEAAYKGCLDASGVIPALAAYDLMLLPTFYEGEGFPGALVEAYMASLPVAVSDWKYNSEYVKEGETGFLVPLGEGEVERYGSIVARLAQDGNRLQAMREQAGKEGEKYTDEAFWRVFEPYLILSGKGKA